MEPAARSDTSAAAEKGQTAGLPGNIGDCLSKYEGAVKDDL